MNDLDLYLKIKTILEAQGLDAANQKLQDVSRAETGVSRETSDMSTRTRGLQAALVGLSGAAQSGQIGFRGLLTAVRGFGAMITGNLSPALISSTAAVGAWVLAYRRIKEAWEEGKPKVAAQITSLEQYNARLESILRNSADWIEKLQSEAKALAAVRQAQQDVEDSQRKLDDAEALLRKERALSAAGADPAEQRRIEIQFNLDSARAREEAAMRKANADRNEALSRFNTNRDIIAHEKEVQEQLTGANIEKAYRERMEQIERGVTAGQVTPEQAAAMRKRAGAARAETTAGAPEQMEASRKRAASAEAENKALAVADERYNAEYAAAWQRRAAAEEVARRERGALEAETGAKRAESYQQIKRATATSPEEELGGRVRAESAAIRAARERADRERGEFRAAETQYGAAVQGNRGRLGGERQIAAAREKMEKEQRDMEEAARALAEVVARAAENTRGLLDVARAGASEQSRLSAAIRELESQLKNERTAQ